MHDALVAHERALATLLGTGAGAAGGAAMLLVARAIMLHEGLADPALALGRLVALHGGRADLVGLGVAVGLGAAVGGLLCRATWRIGRVVPRVIFFGILVPVLWLFAQVFLIGHLQPEAVAAVPFVPFLLGSLAFALFVAILPAARRPKVKDILPEKR